jgi:hypothetical protein
MGGCKTRNSELKHFMKQESAFSLRRNVSGELGYQYSEE